MTTPMSEFCHECDVWDEKLHSLEARIVNLRRELDRRSEVITQLLDQLAERDAEIRDKDIALRDLILNV
jgi:hypothetical protein